VCENFENSATESFKMKNDPAIKISFIIFAENVFKINFTKSNP
jgi:hypothetical protein